MNILNQWLEGKKKDTENIEVPQGKNIGEYRFTHTLKNGGYNECLADLQKALPSLLSTMEAEIRERIGEDERFKSQIDSAENPHDAYIAGHSKTDGINIERFRIHTIIHEYFKTQV